MDSINKNQAEENREDLFGEEAVKKLKELVEKANSCFFVPGSNPMKVFPPGLWLFKKLMTKATCGF